jgi:hypothetical protein
MFGILAVVGILFVGALLALLRVNERLTARMIAGTAGDAGARPGPAMAAYGHSSGAWRSYRSETALAPVAVQWGELLAPETPATIRIPTAQPEPEPTHSETRTPQRTPSIEADVAVPGLQAVATAIALAVGAGLLSWALAWSWKVPVVVLGLALAGGWLWRLGIADSLLWAVESFTGKDVDGDGVKGRPQMSFTLANPATARQTVAKEARQTADATRRAALLAFVDKCFMVGTSESAQGIAAGNRADYLTCRDALLALGVGRWKNPDKPKAGWELAVSRQRARQLVAKHTF